MTDNIKQYLNDERNYVQTLNRKPIIENWLTSPDMIHSLMIIDKHVDYLLHQNGGRQKLKQWFLAGDQNFNAITAERYVINYLAQKNHNLEDNISPDGVDAVLKLGGSEIGIEVTTLNRCVSSWVFTVRLRALLWNSSFGYDKSIEVAYSEKRLWREDNGKKLGEYIDKVNEAIVYGKDDVLPHLGVSIKYLDIVPGWISFRCSDCKDFPWLDLITNKTYESISNKNKQLEKFSRNVLFIGLNQAAPSDGVFPRLFGYLKGDDFQKYPEINTIKEYWHANMPTLPKVIGICYFFYSLDTEYPFYPLKIFWRTEEDKIEINL